MKIAFFGGSFDPPHMGHVLAACYALSTEDVEHVLVVPVFEHAFQKQLLPFVHRVRMAELALAPLAQVTVSTIESELPGPSYTLATLEELKRRDPTAQFRLLIGSDVFSTRHKWQAFDQVTALAPPIVLGRAGALDGAESSLLPEISSSEIRSYLGDCNRAGAHNDSYLKSVVPREVLRYIDENGLYGTTQ